MVPRRLQFKPTVLRGIAIQWMQLLPECMPPSLPRPRRVAPSWAVSPQFRLTLNLERISSAPFSATYRY